MGAVPLSWVSMVHASRRSIQAPADSQTGDGARLRPLRGRHPATLAGPSGPCLRPSAPVSAVTLFVALQPFAACTTANTDSSSPDDTATDSAGDSGSPYSDADFVLVPARTFEMGCTASQADCDADETAHVVTLTHDYFVGVTEVTRAQFEAAMGYTPGYFSDCVGACPVEQVSWYEAVFHANAVSRAMGLNACYSCSGSDRDVVCTVALDPYGCDGYRLLTESEWEGAARCGEELRYSGSNTIEEVAWYTENADYSAHPVAGLNPNACGLFDMSGNAWEWTHDGYGDYESGAVSDPAGSLSSSERVFRGGGWYSDASLVRLANRGNVDPGSTISGVGFRLARLSP